MSRVPLNRARSYIIKTVAIIGGGPGGLFTAYGIQRLVDRPLHVTIFEAESRLGGKVHTAQFDSVAQRYEVGAAEFYDYEKVGEDALKDLVRELGLPIRHMSGSMVLMDGEPVANIDDIRDRLGSDAADALLDFDRRARDRLSRREFYALGDWPVPGRADDRRFDKVLAEIGHPKARAYVEHLIHSDLATEPTHTNIEYGLQNYLMNDPKYMHLYSIEGGNDRLMTSIAARLDAAVRLRCRVQRVTRSARGGFVLQVVEDGVPREHEFDAVIAALPHNAMAHVDFSGPKLSAAVAAHQSHHDHAAHYLRVTLLYEEPFWREHVHGSFWMLDHFGGCCLYDESLRDPTASHGVLGWLLAGDAARDLARETDEEVVRQVLASLPKMLHADGRTPLEARVHRWIGAVSAMPGGIHPMTLDQRHCPEPIDHPHFFIVGDYLYDSTLNGVLDSAEYVAAWVAAQVAQDSTS